VSERADTYCRWAIEAILIAMTVATPWALGGTYPGTGLAIRVGIALVLALWAVRSVLQLTVRFRSDLVLAALGGLTLLTAFQLLPLPVPVLNTLSPHTVDENVHLRPALAERLPSEPPIDHARPQAFPISLSPPDTLDAFTELFALVMLYAAVRANLDGPGAFVRLGWACTANAGLLTLLGIAQLLSSSGHVAFWLLPTEGQIFGPFVNRNHFPFYAAAGVGVGAALLSNYFRDGIGGFLNRPAGIWLLAFVGLATAGILVCRSRGGVVAALAAAASCALIWFRHSRRATGLGWLIGVTPIVVTVASWVGWSALEARLGTLESGRLANEARIELWTGDLTLFARYPALGTGAATHVWVEPTGRVTSGYEDLAVEHAHNEYVEALVEGGVLRLGLTLLLVGGLIVSLVRRHRQVVGTPEGALVLGGLFAVVAVAAQSAVDFGIHLPALSVLAVIFTGMLMGSGAVPPAARRRPVLAIAAALGLVAVAGLFVWDGLTVDRAERNRWASWRLTVGQVPTRAQSEQAVELMTSASVARPRNAQYRHELGQAYLARALHHPPGSAERTADLRAALSQWRMARDLSPVMAPTHARLGRFRDGFVQADPAVVYLERARHLLPTDPEMAYLCGLARWQAGDVPGACSDWQASLSASGQYLPDILGCVLPVLGAEQVLSAVLPETPERILAAANLLDSGGSGTGDRRLFLDKARCLAVAKPEKKAADWELEARLEIGLGAPDRAALAYRRAVGLDARRIDWRMAYAEALRASGDLDGARRELDIVLALEPMNRGARDRRDIVIREAQLRPKK
jgi:tetratricopeptide (TPR) repeat protein